MLYDVSTDSYQIGGGPCKYIILFVKETQQLCLLFLACLHAYAYNFVWFDCSCKKCMFLCPSVKPFSMCLASCWLPKMDMTPKVTGILRQRYAECKAASKVLNRPLPKMALYGYGMSTISKVMYFVRGFLGVPKDTGSVMALIGSILFPLKT
jgi:hypothetical protein